jgi:hypothetical protein
MYIYNAAGEDITIWVYKFKDIAQAHIGGIPASYEWTGKDSPYDNSLDANTDFSLYVARHKQNSGYVRTMDPATTLEIYQAGPYQDSSNLVVASVGFTLTADKLVVVDWIKVQQEYLTGAPQAAQRAAADQALNTALHVAGILITALAAAVAVAGAGAGGPVLVAAGVGGLLAWIQAPTPQSPVPVPPDLVEISAAVRDIVAAELDKVSAENAATHFTQAMAWLVTTGLQYHEKAAQMSPHDLKDFKRVLESYVAANQDFQINLAHMKAHPEQAMYIIPAFLLGIAAQLQLQWLHALLRFAEGTPIKSVDIERFKQEVDSCQTALQKAQVAWSKHCDNEVVKKALMNAPVHSQWIRKFLTKAVTGHEDLTFLQGPLKDLREVIDNCTADLQLMTRGLHATHFIKLDWQPA